MRASSRRARRSTRTSCCRPCGWGSAVTSKRKAEVSMDRRDSDALVLFGATGDLCYRKIYPSLYDLVWRGLLTVPVIGVARAGWSREQFREHVRKSMKEFVPKREEEVVERFVSLLSYVDGDYKERRTFDSLKKALGNATRPLNYLAIPPSVFPVVI